MSSDLIYDYDSITIDDYPKKCVKCGGETQTLWVAEFDTELCLNHYTNSNIYIPPCHHTSEMGLGSGACRHCMIRYSVSQCGWKPIMDPRRSSVGLAPGEYWDMVYRPNFTMYTAFGKTCTNWLLFIKKKRELACLNSVKNRVRKQVQKYTC